MSERLRAFFGGTAVLPDRTLSDAVIVTRGEKIASVRQADAPIPEEAETIDCRGLTVVPGYIDLHVHGGGGADFMDGTPEAIREVCRAHAAHGTTTLFPTTTTGSAEQIHAMLESCKAIQPSSGTTGSSIAGVHLYGPYFAQSKAGCHDADFCRSPMPEEFQQYFESGIVRIATCAAELPGSKIFYESARQHGCLVTCGHSEASWSEMQSAFDAGMRHVDHFWCAMSNVSSVRKRLGVPMQGSMLEFVLDQPDMSTEVIADGMHLSNELLRFAWKWKGPERLCLVTDCNRALDMPPGRYRFGHKDHGAWLQSDGKVGWASADALASSVRGMDHMVRTMHLDAQVPLVDCIRMATLTPAERTGIDTDVGSLQVGKRADLLILDQDLQIQSVWISGKRLTLADTKPTKSD